MADEMTQSEQDAIAKFPAVAEEFCRFIDNCSNYERKRLVQGVSVLLARLCDVAARLPCVNPSTGGTDFSTESIDAHANEAHQLSRRLSEQLGNLDEYWGIFDPTQKEEAILCSLSQDIADIHLDLRDALKLLTSGASLDDIYFDWRFDFRTHWSRHATSALKVAIQISDGA
jgi:putative component of membrane protein insertase Oxa1/YidC/SpoIIIJ protein YidD